MISHSSSPYNEANIISSLIGHFIEIQSHGKKRCMFIFVVGVLKNLKSCWLLLRWLKSEQDQLTACQWCPLSMASSAGHTPLHLQSCLLMAQLCTLHMHLLTFSCISPKLWSVAGSQSSLTSTFTHFMKIGGWESCESFLKLVLRWKSLLIKVQVWPDVRELCGSQSLQISELQ